MRSIKITLFPRGTVSFALFFVSLLLSSCMNMQGNHPAIDSLAEIDGKTPKTYVEAFIEYGAPQARFVGPQAFLLHVSARESGALEMTVTPTSIDPASSEKEVSSRTLSSVKKPLTAEIVRNRLSALAEVLKGPDVPFEGCMNPVRVRLVRADGALLEKEGCRGGLGWPKAVSEAVSAFLTSRAI